MTLQIMRYFFAMYWKLEPECCISFQLKKKVFLEHHNSLPKNSHSVTLGLLKVTWSLHKDRMLKASAIDLSYIEFVEQVRNLLLLHACRSSSDCESV